MGVIVMDLEDGDAVAAVDVVPAARLRVDDADADADARTDETASADAGAD
jgi:DNA gyrase subunit A